MGYWFRARELFFQKAWRPARHVTPYAVAPVTWQGWTLMALWIAAMAVTLGSAAMQSLQSFLYASLATWFGTSAALWMLRGRVKPAR
jgi:hypothetical protein